MAKVILARRAMKDLEKLDGQAKRRIEGEALIVLRVGHRREIYL
jgi:mRNA-degrading endonuclease RelE of RelBE toxin-antitoxin system